MKSRPKWAVGPERNDLLVKMFGRVVERSLARRGWYPTGVKISRKFKVRRRGLAVSGFLGLSFHSQVGEGAVAIVSVTLVLPKAFARSRLDDAKSFAEADDGLALDLVNYECQWDPRHRALFCMLRLSGRALSDVRGILRSSTRLFKRNRRNR